MNILASALQIIVYTVAIPVAFLSIVLFVKSRWPATTLWGLKVSVSAFSTVFIFIGLMTLMIGLTSGNSFIVYLGAFVTLIYLQHFICVTLPPPSSSGFEQAFGKNWENQILPEQQKYFIPHRMILKLPSWPEPQLEQNIPYATIPGTDHNLLCDIVKPPPMIKPSGLAFIFLHGGAFYTMDKNFRTEELFRHLAAQGHVIMDVAFRLAFETDLMGMIHDVKRAIFWMKENAVRYSVNPELITIGGGSSGGYLGLMAAFTGNDPRFTPLELIGKNINCAAVITEYPVSDLEALYYHTDESKTAWLKNKGLVKKSPIKIPSWLKGIIGNNYNRLGIDKGIDKVGTIAPLMGGTPDQCPEKYTIYSPFTYVNSTCPPTLLIHGNHDIMAPVKSTCLLYKKLIQQKVPALLHILPQTDHAFSRFFPSIAPAAHNLFYDMERFMALIANQKN
ncbi:alpha/beta hydrolase fold domain-containing protein [Shivajiella indica]|uniref:Alpha/beta hydrolase fold domain-containing protein n=1 Tax=Shivajiella indica TaxID=872115 RepID=A0ABW5B7T1_9BACT